MDSFKNKSFLGYLALIWLTVVLCLYYVNHKPISPDFALSVVQIFWNVGAAFILIVLAGGIGLRIFEKFELPQFSNNALNIAVQAAAGFGLLSVGILVFGSTIGINTLWAWLILIILVAVFRRSLWGWLKKWSGLSVISSAHDNLSKLILAGSAVILLLSFISAQAPPVKFDALVYHLALPRDYLNAGKIIYVPENMFWGMPQLGEMLYTWIMALAGQEAAATLGWLIGGLAILGLFGCSSRFLGRRAAWVTIASLLSGFTLEASLSWGYVDWSVILDGLVFVVFVDDWRSSREPRKLLLAGIFAGLALSTKYTAGILTLVGLGIIIWDFFKKKRGVTAESAFLASGQEITEHSLLKSILIFGLPVILVYLPWGIKNMLPTGNPFYPLLFPAGEMDRFRLDFYQQSAWGNWQDVLFLPLRATLAGVEGAPGYSASIGPLLIGLAPFSLLSWSANSRQNRNIVGTALLVFLIGLLIWITAGRYSVLLIQSRMYFSIFPAFALLAGAGYSALDEIHLPGIRLGRISGVLIVLVFGFSVLKLGLSTLNQSPLQRLAAISTANGYLDKNLGWYAPAMRAITELPPSTRVLMLWEPRSLYCLPQCVPDEVLDRWLREKPGQRSQTEILKGWREEGFSYLLYYQLGADFVRGDDARYKPDDWKTLDELLSELPKPVKFGDYYLYSLTQ
jgi:hypothetical protein